MPLIKHHAGTHLQSFRVNRVKSERSLMAWLHLIYNSERLQLRMEDVGKFDYPAHLQSYVTNLLHCCVIIVRAICVSSIWWSIDMVLR